MAKVVVFDDDPTGTQTAHGVHVLTEWSVAALGRELLDATRAAFFMLTNSRALPAAGAEALATEIGNNLRVAGDRTGVPFVVMSRGDSTLRGHFPGEVTALADALGE